MKLRILAYGMKIQATYFQKSWKNPLIGQYHTLSGTVEFFDPSVHLRIDDTEIQIQDNGPKGNQIRLMSIMPSIP